MSSKRGLKTATGGGPSPFSNRAGSQDEGERGLGAMTRLLCEMTAAASQPEGMCKRMEAATSGEEVYYLFAGDDNVLAGRTVLSIQ